MLNPWIPKLAIFRQRLNVLSHLRRERPEKAKDIEEGMNFTNTERESFKKRQQEMQNQLIQVKDEKLYMEVYQRRENFFGIKEAATVEEETKGKGKGGGGEMN